MEKTPDEGGVNEIVVPGSARRGVPDHYPTRRSGDPGSHAKGGAETARLLLPECCPRTIDSTECNETVAG